MKKEDILTLVAFLFIAFGIMEIFNLSFRVSSQISIFIILLGSLFTYFRLKWRSRKAKIEAEKSLNNLSINIGTEKDIIAQYRETFKNIENPEKKLEAMKALEELENLSLTHPSSGTPSGAPYVKR